MRTSDRPIIIAGAGISGLTAALCLTRAGFPVHLIERAGRFDEVGAGLQLSPNASRILIALGADKLLEPALGKPQALIVRSAQSGRVLIEMPLGGEAIRRWGAPMWVAHRADLQQALLELVRAEPNLILSPGQELQDVGEEENGASATLIAKEERQTVTSPLFIAADGVWSRAAARFENGAEPRFSGRTAYRATVAMSDVPASLRKNATGLWLGHRAHLVHYPLRGGTLLNIVAIVSDNRRGDHSAKAATPAEVIAGFGEFAALAQHLLNVPQTWLSWPLFTRPPLRRWPGRRILTIGDAAHPMLPFLAQGASMAIEDAAVLARCLGAEADVDRAIARFKMERTARVSRVQSEAERNSKVFHLGGIAGLARDMALSALGATGLAGRYDWLYGFKA